MTLAAGERLILAASIQEARAALGDGRVALAGGTWLMRAPVRGEQLPARFVAVGRIAALRKIEVEEDRLVIGAAVTHSALVQALQHYPQLSGLKAAAALSANPAVRRIATIGGNLCSVAFAASDLAPAMLALDAHVTLETPEGHLTLPMAEFLRRRAEFLPRALLTAVHVPLSVQYSAHQRLPLRKAGDYPAAIVSLAVIGDRLKAAVGSVEPVARRWHRLESAMDSELPSPDRAAELAAAANDFEGRDGPEADGWYRRQVLPVLIKRGMQEILEARGR
jgi:aerobic carbon-monoxide dehydrogenase medium subunit